MKQTVTGIVMALVCAGMVHAGVSYTAVTRAKDARGREKEVSRMRAVVDGLDARIDVAAHSGPVPNGGYLVTRDGAVTVYMIDPGKKTYTQWDIDKLAGMAGAIMQGSGGLLNMSVTSHKNEKLLDEAGPEMLGVPTRHYKFRTSYTMEMAVMGFKQTSTIATEQEIWTGQGLADDATALWKRVTSFKTGIADIDKLVSAETGKVEGLPLKTIVISRTTDHRGRQQTSETVTEVTEMKTFTPKQSAFEIPEGYTKAEMAIPGLTDGGGSTSTGNAPAAALNGLLKSLGR